MTDQYQDGAAAFKARTEAAVNRLCQTTTEAVAYAAGGAMAEAPDEFKHIALMHAGSWMLNASAVSAFHAFRGEQVSPNDPRVLALMSEWLDALKLYPDMQALNEALTHARDKAFPDA